MLSSGELDPVWHVYGRYCEALRRHRTPGLAQVRLLHHARILLVCARHDRTDWRHWLRLYRQMARVSEPQPFDVTALFFAPGSAEVTDEQFVETELKNMERLAEASARAFKRLMKIRAMKQVINSANLHFYAPDIRTLPTSTSRKRKERSRAPGRVSQQTHSPVTRDGANDNGMLKQ